MNKIQFKKGAQLSAMLLLATEKFHGDFDKAGQPYILHCLRVMHLLNSEDEELNCIALGHDLVEDGKVTYQYLYRNYSARIVEGIRNLSKVPGETDDEYVTRLMLAYDSVLVKLSDLRHNSDIRRLKGLTEKDLARIAKYHRFHTVLRSAKLDFELHGKVSAATHALNKQLNGTP